MVVLQDVVTAIILYLNLRKVLRIIERRIIELGAAGNLLRMRMEELSSEISEGLYLVKDYITEDYLSAEGGLFIQKACS